MPQLLLPKKNLPKQNLPKTKTSPASPGPGGASRRKMFRSPSTNSCDMQSSSGDPLGDFKTQVFLEPMRASGMQCRGCLSGERILEGGVVLSLFLLRSASCHEATHYQAFRLIGQGAPFFGKTRTMILHQHTFGLGACGCRHSESASKVRPAVKARQPHGLSRALEDVPKVSSRL